MSDGTRICIGCGKPHDRHVSYGEGYKCWCEECRPKVMAHNKASIHRNRHPSDDILSEYMEGYFLKPGQMYTKEEEKEIEDLVKSYFEVCKGEVVKEEYLPDDLPRIKG